MKVETSIKVQPASERGLKAAVSLLRAKKEEQKTKLEQKTKSEQNVKFEQRVKSESSAKTEPSIKAERRGSPIGSTKDSSDWGQALLQRGLTLRALAEKSNSCKSERGSVKSVKRERTLTKSGKKRKKHKVTAKRRNASRTAMARVYPLSQEFSSFVGATALSRPEAVKRVWARCKEQGMLNPENKREIVFNDELQELFGCQSAVMTQITSLLVPHIDIGAGPVELAKVKADGVKHSKRECATPMKSQKSEVKTELPARGRGRPKLEAKVKTDIWNAAATLHPKLEALPPAKYCKSELVRPMSAVTVSPSEASPPAKYCKSELGRPMSAVTVSPSDVEEASAAVQPRLIAICRDSATVVFTAPPGALRFLAVALPDSSADAVDKCIQELCKVEVHEMANGVFEQHAQAQFAGLDPSTAYRVSIRVCAAFPGANDAMCEADSQSVALPQRARPGEWAPHEALLWSFSLQVPEFSNRMTEYSIDGTTLLSLGEEDLRGLGLTAPFLLRRVLAALEALRSSPIAA